MNTMRLLLPFTHGIHIDTIEYAVLLAKSSHATLVPLVLLPVSNVRRSKDVRLEHIQQAKDFMHVVQRKAAVYGVPVEYIEVVTSDIIESIRTIAEEKDCSDVLLFMENRKDILLHINEIKRIVSNVDRSHHIIHFYPHALSNQSFLKRLANIFSGQKNIPVFIESEIV